MAAAPQPILVASPADFGKATRLARERLGLGTREASRKCRVSYRFYWDLESGKRTARLDKVVAVAKALGIAIMLVPGAPR